MIHHGGIGTAAQCFAAGVPQLMMPMAFDQPDNALRAQTLGVARWHAPAEFTADNVTASLDTLLGSGEVSRAVLTCRSRLAGIDGIAMACDRLEAGDGR
jgi:UDP:flavonoid glycosyltransferase YjiC (YdhE family)